LSLLRTGVAMTSNDKFVEAFKEVVRTAKDCGITEDELSALLRILSGEEKEMKQPIAWHETNLRNRMLHARALEREIQSKNEDLKRMQLEIMQLQHQISMAKMMGKDGFDEERFLKKKGDR